jgi:hypothetical protein
MRGLTGIWVLCPVFLIASDFLIAKKAAPQHLTTTKNYASQLAKKKLQQKKKSHE